jgi:hypothetical protein
MNKEQHRIEEERNIKNVLMGHIFRFLQSKRRSKERNMEEGKKIGLL